MPLIDINDIYTFPLKNLLFDKNSKHAYLVFLQLKIADLAIPKPYLVVLESLARKHMQSAFLSCLIRNDGK